MRWDWAGGLALLNVRSAPVNAVIAAAVPVVLVALIGGLSVAWSYAAFNILLYYGITISPPWPSTGVAGRPGSVSAPASRSLASCLSRCG